MGTSQQGRPRGAHETDRTKSAPRRPLTSPVHAFSPSPPSKSVPAPNREPATAAEISSPPLGSLVSPVNKSGGSACRRHCLTSRRAGKREISSKSFGEDDGARQLRCAAPARGGRGRPPRLRRRRAASGRARHRPSVRRGRREQAAGVQPHVRVRPLHDAAVPAVRQVLRHPLQRLPRRAAVRRARRLLHAPRQLRPGQAGLPEHAVQRGPAGLPGEAAGGHVHVRGEQVHDRRGHRCDHARHRGRRRRRQGAAQAVAGRGSERPAARGDMQQLAR